MAGTCTGMREPQPGSTATPLRTMFEPSKDTRPAHLLLGASPGLVHREGPTTPVPPTTWARSPHFGGKPAVTEAKFVLCWAVKPKRPRRVFCENQQLIIIRHYQSVLLFCATSQAQKTPHISGMLQQAQHTASLAGAKSQDRISSGC